MTLTARIRQTVREAYNFRCGYCGVTETQTGSELEIDHFQPLAHGGTDNLDNLVYACSACNRFKGSYWPIKEAPESLRLLHPLRDARHDHLQLTNDGQLAGLTPRG